MFPRDPYVEIYKLDNDEFMVCCHDCWWTEQADDRVRLAIAASRHQQTHGTCI